MVKSTKTLPLYVVKGDGPSLLGRNWLMEIKPPLSYEEQIEALLQEHKVVFQEGLGQISKFEATSLLMPTATPKFCKARSVSFALQANCRERIRQVRRCMKAF